MTPPSRARPGRAAASTTRTAQLAYLFERSAFYREKLGAAGIDSAEAAGGLADIARLPLTEKHELRATCTPDNPIGAHLCATPDEIVRIYSTSGTTGTPSYIPLTAGDLDNWVTGLGAQLRAPPASPPAQRIVSTYNAGPFVAGAALAAFDRIGLCHIPVGTGNTERLLRGDRAAAARGRGADALLRRLPRRVGGRARRRPARLERRARARGGRARRRRAGVPREARGGLGRAGHRGDGHRRHRRRRSGASARSRTGCTSARAASSTPS